MTILDKILKFLFGEKEKCVACDGAGKKTVWVFKTSVHSVGETFTCRACKGRG